MATVSAYLKGDELPTLERLLRTFFTLPYSTDLDGKDAETLLKLAKGIKGAKSKRKELFDIVDGELGYSVKTLFKPISATRVDLQEQRFCDVAELRAVNVASEQKAKAEGDLLLKYMQERIRSQMKLRGVRKARSLILLKYWDKTRCNFSFRYWEEDFIGFIDNLVAKNGRGEINWLIQGKGLHGRDTLRKDDAGNEVRLLRMHYKHNQIFTDHDIPPDATTIKFSVARRDWDELAKLLYPEVAKAESVDGILKLAAEL